VVVGVAAAYALTNLLSVVVGGLLGEALPTRAIGIGGGVLFLAFALWTLRRSGDEGSDGAGGEGGGVSWVSVAVSVGAAMVVAELGDKTMLATAALAARGNPVLVWIGATIGIIASGLLGVGLGRALGARLPERATRIASAVLFAAFGVVLLVTAV